VRQALPRTSMFPKLLHHPTTKTGLGKGSNILRGHASPEEISLSVKPRVILLILIKVRIMKNEGK